MTHKLTLLVFPDWPSSARPCPEARRWMAYMREVQGLSPMQVWQRCTNYQWIVWILVNRMGMSAFAPKSVQSATPAIQKAFDAYNNDVYRPQPAEMAMYAIHSLPEEDQVAYAEALKSLTSWREVREALLKCGWR